MRAFYKTLSLIASIGLAACNQAGSHDREMGPGINRTIDGVAYRVAFVMGAYADTSTGRTAEISPFPLFYDGVLVVRRDGAVPSEVDRAAAQSMAALYCSRSGEVPYDADGYILPNKAGWFFGKCYLEENLRETGVLPPAGEPTE